jgi:hypothetical protein
LNKHSINQQDDQLPLGMRFVVGYFFVTGLIEIVLPFAKLHHTSYTLNYQLGLVAAIALFQIPAFLAGVGLALRKRWAEYLGGILLAYSTLSFVVEFDQGVLATASSGSTAEKLTLLSIPMSVAWHGLWAFLLFRNRPFRSHTAAARA